ncbi:energy transducer TonB [Burkholderia sp. 22PA0099]|uniref:energy transducer TonB n=1 Tax=Burkholderia sp. 22PA0099 TaxID=3237372 RepID=UPI0039C0EBAD
MVKPDFPGAGRFRGVVKLGFEVSVAGEIENITMIESTGHWQLDESALQALRKSRCKPYLENGKPRRAHYIVPYKFEANDSHPVTSYSEASKAALLLLPGTPPNEGVGQTYRVNIPICDVRRAPAQKARVFGTYSQGWPLTIYERRHEFARVSPDGAAPEWVVFSLLRP